MTIKQSKYVDGPQLMTPKTFEAGVVNAKRFEHKLSADQNADDILELCPLPSGCTIVDYHIDLDNITDIYDQGVTAKIGIMSGTVGDTDASRTVGSELASAVAVNAVTKTVKKEALRLAASNSDRSIGVQFSADVEASSQVVAVTLFYVQ